MAREVYRYFDPTADDPREYQADDMAEMYREMYADGIKGGGENLRVKAAGSGLQVQVSPGFAMIRGYGYWLKEEQGEPTKSLNLQMSHGTLARMDRVVLRLSTLQQDRFIKLFVLEGTPAASPVPPALTRNANICELSLAQVHVRPGAINLTGSDIVDERYNEDVCGLIDALYTLDGTQFEEKAQEILDGLAGGLDDKADKSELNLKVGIDDFTRVIPYGESSYNNMTREQNVMLTPAPSRLTKGMAIRVNFPESFSLTRSLTINGGLKSTIYPDCADQYTGYYPAGIYTLIYDGTRWRLQGAMPYAGGDFKSAISYNGNPYAYIQSGKWTPEIELSGMWLYTSRSGSWIKMGPLVYLSYEIRINVHSLNAGSGLVKGIPFEPTSFSAAPMTEYKGFRGLVGTPTAITQPGYNCLSFRQQLPHSSVPGDGITYGNIVSIGGSDDVCWVGSILYRCE